LLPKFVFLPEKIQYPALPDLPDPLDFDIWIKIDMPEIPQLPSPPNLPPLPDLELDADIQLPTLPPAPKIPNIAPAINKVIKIADFIGTVFCIFKSGVWLVAEHGVKTRIEQLTQRTRDVEPFDSISLVLPEPPLPGFDIQVSAVVDLEFSFDELYDVFDEVARVSNKQVSEMMWSVKKSLIDWQANLLGEDVSDFLNDPSWSIIWDGANIDLDLDLDPNGGTTWDIDLENLLTQAGDFQRPELSERQQAFHEKEHPGGEYWEVKNRLLADISLSLPEMDTVEQQKFLAISNLLEKNIEVRRNYTGIEKVKQDTKAFLWNYDSDISQLKESLDKWWDYFLQNEMTDYIPVWEEEEVLVEQFSTNVLEGDDWIRDTLIDQPHPLESWIDTQRQLVDGYANALETKSAADLSMDEITHELSTSYISGLQKWLLDLSQFVPVIPDVSNLYQEPTFLAQSDINSDSEEFIQEVQDPSIDISPEPVFAPQSNIYNLADETWLNEVDLSAYIQWFFVVWDDDKYHNVMWRIEKAELINDSGSYMYSDINLDGNIDIISRDKNSVYAKYNTQNDITPGAQWGNRITLGWPWSSASQLSESVEPDDWYINGWKVWSPNTVNYAFARQWSSYTSMWFSWDYDNADGYIISVTHKSDVHKQRDGEPRSNSNTDQRYVLVLPESMDPEWLDLYIPHEIDNKSIQELIDDETIIAVDRYDGRASKNLPRKWYYTQMAWLELKKEQKNFFWLWWWWVLEKVSPRSVQELAWAQLVSDNERPTLDLELIRTKIDEKVSEWSLLQWQVLTTYQLSWTRLDNTAVKENRITYDNEIIWYEKTDRVDLSDLYYETPLTESFMLSARDALWNQRDIEVDLEILSPSIKINEVRALTDAAYEVETELSDTIDDGNIAFMRNRYGRWEEMNPYQFGVSPIDPIVVWGTYISDDDTIQMVDSAGSQRWIMDKNTWKIEIPPEFQDSTDIAVSMNENWKPTVVVLDTDTWVSLFSVSLSADGIGEWWPPLTITDNWYESFSVNDDLVGNQFLWWTCVSPSSSECQIFIDTNGNLLIPPQRQDQYTVSYDFDDISDDVIYTINNDLQQDVLQLRFQAQSF